MSGPPDPETLPLTGREQGPPCRFHGAWGNWVIVVEMTRRPICLLNLKVSCCFLVFSYL